MISLAESGSLGVLNSWISYEYLVLILVTLFPQETDLRVLAEFMLELCLLRLVQCDRSPIVARYSNLANLLY